MTAERSTLGEHCETGGVDTEQRRTMRVRVGGSLLSGRTADMSGASPAGA